MTTVEFLAYLRGLGVELAAENEVLHCDAPEAVLTEELEEEIKERKPEILALLRQMEGSVASASPTIRRTRRSGSQPLSFAQSRLWFLDQLERDSTFYNESACFRIDGDLIVDALRRALDTIVSRHETLCTTFVAVDGIPAQVILKDRRIELKIVDVGGEEASARESEAMRLVTQEAGRPFDLSSDLLLRASLVRLGPGEHILHLVMHHIAADGWSFGILFKELSTLYRAFRDGTPFPLPELPIQYVDYSAWQREYLDGTRLDSQLQYWKGKLQDAELLIELPSDRPRSPTQNYKGARHPLELRRELADSLHLLARRESVTLYMLLLAAFNALLHRYCDQKDIIIGSPVAGRSAIELEDLIGFFANNLVLRTDCSGDPSFRELLTQVREVVLGAHENQDLPFEKLVEELQPERDRSRNPLFQVMFVQQNASDREMLLDGLTVQPIDVHNGTSKVDLFLSVLEGRDGLKGFLEYSTDLFEESTIQRMVGHFQTLLEGIVEDPNQRISDLPLLTDSERGDLLVGSRGADSDYPRNRLMHNLFEAQAALTPDRTAVRFGESSFSYSELDQRAGRMAQALRSRGVGRGQRVGLCVQRGAEMLAAVLGILKAGAAYVPLDPFFPAERLRFMVEDAQLALLVSTSDLADAFGLPRERQLLLDNNAAEIASQSDRQLVRDAALDAHPEDPAYVIYTSGSTGKPKGVVVPHRAVVNFLTSMACEPGLTEDDVLLAVTTFSFDIAVLELHLPLTVGAAVVIASRDEAADGYALSGLLKQHRVSVMQATPVTWRLLLESGWAAGDQFKALVGGETLPRELAEQLLACGVELWNMYGPTETTVWSTCTRITNISEGITIGKPIASTSVYILDAQRNLCPIGVPGELCIGGDGLALGYWNRPELTAERFIPNPLNATSRAKLYLTGDRARWRNDGTLEHLGRLDHQVKIRGYRIELGEIEAAIADHPAIRETVVVVRGDVPCDPRLVAYLVAEEPPEDLMDRLRVKLRAQLPEYMVPSAFVILDTMPLTPNAKIDRKALPAPERSAEQQGAYVSPRTETEEILAGIWAEVLGLERVGINDNFFDLGGNSIQSFQVVAKAKQAGKKLKIMDVFQYQTIVELAEAAVRISDPVLEGELHSGDFVQHKAKLDSLPKESHSSEDGFKVHRKAKISASEAVKWLGLD